MNKIIFVALLLLFAATSIEGKNGFKSRSSGSSRSSSSSRKTNSKPAPTSISYPQPTQQKPSVSGWQEKPAQRTQTSNNQDYSYPSSHTGLSGNNQPKQPPSYQESVQRSNVPNNYAAAGPTQVNNQPSHSYPSSNGMSGNSQSGVGYPAQQGGGLSGAGSPPNPAYPVKSFGNNNAAQTPQRAPEPTQGNNQPIHSYPSSNTNNNNGQHGYSPNNYGQSGVPPNNFGHNYNQGPPSHTNVAPGYGGYGGNGGFGGHGGYGGYGGHGMNPGPQTPGYFGNYGKGNGGVSRSRNVLTGVGIAGAGIGTVLTGLALWNLARSTGHNHHTVIYDNKGQPVAVAPENGTTAAQDSLLADLVNCTLTISSNSSTEVLAIPCAIATSFTPEADVKDVSTNNNATDNTKCTVTVVTKTNKEFMTTIPCSILLNTAAENNVTEPPIFNNGTDIISEPLNPVNGSLTTDEPTALKLTGTGENISNLENLNCTLEPGVIRDPINPCFSVTGNLTVLPLKPIE